MRAKKGTVTVESFRGMLRLRLPRKVFNGEQKYLSLGLADTLINREIAGRKATDIEYDIALERFDHTLDRYRSNYTNVALPLLIDLWEKYTEFKTKELSITTINKDFKKTKNHILELPTQKINNPLKIRSYLLNNLTPEAAKRALVQINACCEWAVLEGLISNNPFANIKIKSKSTKKSINPFTKPEKELIITAFENSETHSHYANFVKFLFLTGCRPSEAIALRWENISQDLTIITFSEAYVEKQRKDTKTHKIRRFPINTQLKSLLASMKPSQHDTPLFVSKDGCIIDGHNFSEREWKPLLKTLPIKYRVVYNTRHTFITHCLESGIPINQISQWVGNSPKTIWEHYAGLTTKFEVPEF